MTDLEILKTLTDINQMYYDDPVFFAHHAIGAWTWSKMEEILYSIRDNEKTICYACHGSSKTFTAAIAAAWWFNTRINPESTTKVITTAPTHSQVEDLLWSEINSIYANSRIKLEGECLNVKIKADSKDANYAKGFSTDKPHRAEGYHAWNQLYIFDEAKGVAEWMWDSAMAQMGGGNCRILVISTTDGVQPGSEFHKAAKADKYKGDWNRITIDCRDLPTFTGEKMRRVEWSDDNGFAFDLVEKDINNLYIQLSTPKWEQELKKKWGSDSVLYLTKCRGQIVDELPEQIIPLWKVMQMFGNYKDPDFDDTGEVQCGADIARMGDDSTVIWKRKGLKILNNGPLELNKKLNFEIVDSWENNKYISRDECKVKVDDTGVGGGVTDELIRRGYILGKQVIPVCFNQNPNDEDHYDMAIDEMWFKLEEIIQDIACPYNEELMQQLTGRKKLSPNKKGQLRVESKQAYKDRTKGKSPDLADAFLLCFYEVVLKQFGFGQSNVKVY